MFNKPFDYNLLCLYRVFSSYSLLCTMAPIDQYYDLVSVSLKYDQLHFKNALLCSASVTLTFLSGHRKSPQRAPLALHAYNNANPILAAASPSLT